MRVVVTGASGFLGKRVLPRLLQEEYEVLALTRSSAAAQVVSDLRGTPEQGDLDDPASVTAAFQRCKADVLVNLASLGFGHADTIITAAEEARIDRALFISTTAVFTTLEVGTKSVRLHAEAAIQRSDLRWTILRPTMIYGGPDDRNMARLLCFLRRWGFVPLPGGGKHLQQPVHVEDLAEVVVAAVGSDVAIGRIYDIAGPEPMPFKEIVRQACQALGKGCLTIPLPLKPLTLLLKKYEDLTGSSLRVKAEQLGRLAEDKAFDITSAKNDLGYRPRSFREGIRQEVEALA